MSSTRLPASSKFARKMAIVPSWARTWSGNCWNCSCDTAMASGCYGLMVNNESLCGYKPIAPLSCKTILTDKRYRATGPIRETWYDSLSLEPRRCVSLSHITHCFFHHLDVRPEVAVGPSERMCRSVHATLCQGHGGVLHVLQITWFLF